MTNVPGTMPFAVAATSITVAANQTYLLTNNAFTTVTLPTTANSGDAVTISGLGTNGWQVRPASCSHHPAPHWSATVNSSSPNAWFIASTAD